MTHTQQVRARSRRALAVAAIAVGIACTPNPVAQADAAQVITELTDAIGELQQNTAILQEQVDSLKLVVARQDTMIARLSAVTGVPAMPR